MGRTIRALTTALAGRSASLAPLVILAALFAVVDVASRAMGERLSRLRIARFSGLGWLDAFRVSGMALAGGVGTRTALFSQKQPGGVFTIADMHEHPASVWFVDTNAAGAGNTVGHGQNPDKPFSTIAYAFSSDLLASGDTVYVMPGHTESVVAAGTITADIAGVKVIGLGEGSSRPQITFATLNGASFLVSAANVTVKNIIGIGNKDGLTQPFHVTGDDCTLDIEWRDTSALIEAVAVVYADTVSRLNVDLKYRGFTAGDAAARVVQLIAVTGARINLDAYGVVSTAWVNFTGTLSTDVGVFGRAYTQGVTNGSRLVVDTITGSKWWTVIEDMSAGAVYSGGSAAALASDDISSANSSIVSTGVVVSTANSKIDSVGTLAGSGATSAAVSTASSSAVSIGVVVASAATSAGVSSALSAAVSVGTQAGSVGTLVSTANSKADSVGTLAGSGATSAAVSGASSSAVSVGVVVASAATSAAVSSALSAATSVGVVAGSGATSAALSTSQSSVVSVGTQADSVGTLASTGNSKADSVGTQTGSVGTLVSAIGRPIGKAASLADNVIPNNVQAAGGLLATATGGDVYIEEVVLSKDGTLLTGPTNVELSCDNVYGPNGADDVLAANVVGGLGAQDTLKMSAGGVTALKPFVLESGKKLYIHGNDAAGTSAGNLRYAIIARALTAGATLA